MAIWPLVALLPGWNIEAIEDVEFFAPFKFYHNKPRTVTVLRGPMCHGPGV